jgi:DNA-binding Lrp family transcriptional regulator
MKATKNGASAADLKFVQEVAAMKHELRKQGTSAASARILQKHVPRHGLRWVPFLEYHQTPEIEDMVPFFVQIKCKLGQSYAVANGLAEAEIASEIYSTAGDYDLLVKFYVESGIDIGHFVNEKVQIIPGIQDTHTIITFKAF